MGAAIGAGIGGSIGAVVGIVAGAGLQPYRESIQGIEAWKNRHPEYDGASDQEVLESMAGATHAAMGACAAMGAILGGIIGALVGEPDTLAQQQQSPPGGSPT